MFTRFFTCTIALALLAALAYSPVQAKGKHITNIDEKHKLITYPRTDARYLTPDQVPGLADVVRAELCGVDLLINNAGRQVDHDVVTGLDMSAARDEVAVNLLAPIAVTAALMPLLLASPDAAVVNVSSAPAFAPAPRSPVYAASKAGLAAWTHALRAQLEGTAVRVVDVVPPLVATDMTVGRHEGAVQPEAVASAVVRGLTRRRTRVVVGKARALAAIHRVSPALARRMMRDR